SVKLVITCSADCPAIFTPEWTISPQVCTRVPFLGCSSKLTHCARTTPSAWSIHPTLCAGWQLVITWLTTVFTGSSTSMSSRLPFTPNHLAINICELIPSPPIRKNLPGELAASFGGHTILKSKHGLLSYTPVFRFAEDFLN